MFKREYVARHGKNHIVVMNAWFSGAKLYIYGDLVDTDNSKIATTSTAMLRGRFQTKMVRDQSSKYSGARGYPASRLRSV